MSIRLCKERMGLSSRIKVSKKIHSIMREHFKAEVPQYDIDIDFLPRINLTYYGRPRNAFIHLTLSWLVWDFQVVWDDNGLPKKIQRKQSDRR